MSSDQINVSKNSNINNSGASNEGRVIKDEVGAVEMIRTMSRDDKLLLNDMVQSVLYHQ